MNLYMIIHMIIFIYEYINIHHCFSFMNIIFYFIYLYIYNRIFDNGPFQLLVPISPIPTDPTPRQGCVTRSQFVLLSIS